MLCVVAVAVSAVALGPCVQLADELVMAAALTRAPETLQTAPRTTEKNNHSNRSC